jgi:hypothetical protein
MLRQMFRRIIASKQSIEPLADVSGDSGSSRSAESAGMVPASTPAKPTLKASKRSATPVRTSTDASIADLSKLRSAS